MRAPTILFRADLSSSGCDGVRFNDRTLFCGTRTCNGAIRDDGCPEGVAPEEVCCFNHECPPGEYCVDGVCQPPCQRCQHPVGDACFLFKSSSKGSGDGQVDSPRGVAVRADGTVYVADTGNSRIQVFDAGGAFLGTWGDHGSGAGQFRLPVGVAVSPTGIVYVADPLNHRVQAFCVQQA